MAKLSRPPFHRSALIAVSVVVVVLISLIFYELHLTQGPRESISNFVANTVGVLIVVLCTFFIGRYQGVHSDKQQRLATTFELHRDFTSEVMLRARSEADKLLANRPLDSISALYWNLPEVETRSIFQLLGFYDRLWVAVHHNRVEEELVPELFGRIFYWWYEVCFAHNIDEEWQESHHYRELKDWLDKHPHKDHKVINYTEKWQQYAKNSYFKRKQALQSDR